MKKNVFLALCLIISGCATSNSFQEESLKSLSVQITNNGGSCSGEQVHAQSGHNYILTASHCKGLMGADGSFTIYKENGMKLKRRFIAEDPTSDLMLIEGLPGVKGLDIAFEYDRGQHVRTFTHGKSKPTYRTEGVLVGVEETSFVLEIIGDSSGEERCLAAGEKNSLKNMDSIFGTTRVCAMTSDEMAITASVVPGSSGGMVVNDYGELVGVVSATDGYFGYAVLLKDIRRFMAAY